MALERKYRESLNNVQKEVDYITNWNAVNLPVRSSWLAFLYH
jgi:hypothetical protein